MSPGYAFCSRIISSDKRHLSAGRAPQICTEKERERQHYTGEAALYQWKDQFVHIFTFAWRSVGQRCGGGGGGDTVIPNKNGST